MTEVTGTDRSYSRERGDTLIEVLVAVVVIALAVTAIVGALVAGIGASGEHRNLAVDDTLLKSQADALKQRIELGTNPQFHACAAPSDYQGLISQHAGYTVTVQVQYWSGTAFGTSCPSDPRDQQLQLVQITAATSDGAATQALSFVVRDPSYANTATTA